MEDFLINVIDLKEHFQHPIIMMEGNVDEIEEITENPLIFYGAIFNCCT